MDSNHKPYSYIDSFKRIDDILNQSDLNYEEVDSLPDRDKLTFTNGFYAYCSAIFIDIRGSSKLPSVHRRPTLARIYRAFISEAVAVLNGDPNAREVNIVGDCVWSVINTPYKENIDRVFQSAFTLNSMVKTLNCKLRKRGTDPIRVGIGMAYGRALMIKAGYSGSGLNDVVYMGDVVNRAAKLASYGNQGWGDEVLMVDSVFQGNLNDQNKGFLTYNQSRGCYHGTVVSVAMEEWYQENCAS